MTGRGEASASRLAARGYEDEAGLERALSDPSVAVRSEAAFVLGEQGDEAAVAALERALGDESARVRVEAAYALARLGRRDAAVPLLHKELEGRLFADAPLRAARSLARLGDPSGYPRVIDALGSELPSNRMEAIAVLPDFMPFAGQDEIDPVAALKRALDDPEELLRRDARAQLDALGAA